MSYLACHIQSPKIRKTAKLLGSSGGMLAAKATHSSELSSAEARVGELTVCLEQGVATIPIRKFEPLLHRVLEAPVFTEEGLSLVDRAVVYDPL